MRVKSCGVRLKFKSRLLYTFTGRYTTRKIYAHKLISHKTKSDTRLSSAVRILISRFLMVVCVISQFVFLQKWKKITVARGYQFYFLVFKTIIYSLAALVRKIVLLPLEKKKTISSCHCAISSTLILRVWEELNV